MRIDQLGEFGLIERIARRLPVPGADVIVGIGDDVAVLKSTGDQVWLATCDVQMEGAHFLRHAVSPRDLGCKALAINLSDIAATGGTPRYALVSLGLPGDLDVEFIDELYAGLASEASAYQVDIAGGNISKSKLGFFIDIFLVGQAPREDVVLRSGAQPGDKILVTGTLGDAAAGVLLLTNPAVSATASYAPIARARLNRPTPRVAAGRCIGAAHAATAMLDVSDGLASDLGHILDQSAVGAYLLADQLPVAPDNRALSLAAHGDEWHLALYGGEDYELLFTVPSDRTAALVSAILQQTGTAVSVIGEIRPAEEGRRLRLPDGQEVSLEPAGWDHFLSKPTALRGGSVDVIHTVCALYSK